MKIVKKVTAQLAARKRELLAELEQVDGALRALAGAEGGSRDLGPVSHAVARAAERRQTAARASPAPAQTPRPPRTARKAPPAPARPLARPARARAQPGQPAEETGEPTPFLRDTPGTMTTVKGRTYTVCPKCGKRTETNPCAVCGKQIRLNAFAAEAALDNQSRQRRSPRGRVLAPKRGELERIPVPNRPWPHGLSSIPPETFKSATENDGGPDE